MCSLDSAGRNAPKSDLDVVSAVVVDGGCEMNLLIRAVKRLRLEVLGLVGTGDLN